MGNSVSAVQTPQIGEVKLSVLPQGWEKLATDITTLDDSPIPISIALRQPSIGDASSALLSDNRLSQKQAQALLQPDPQEVNDVLKWLKDNDVTGKETANGWIEIKVTPSKAEQLLSMTLSHYQYLDGPPVLKTQQYHIPEHLTQAIDFFHPISNFMAPKHEVMSSPPPPVAASQKFSHTNQTDSPCLKATVPSCIRKMYNMPLLDSGPLPLPGSSETSLGIAGFLDEYANHQDVEYFLQLNAPQIAATGYNFSTELIHGGQNSQDPRNSGTEAALDMQYAMSLAYPSPITYYSTGGRGVQLDIPSGEPGSSDTNEPYLDFIYAMLARSDAALPKVLSISYADDELSVPESYAQRVCDGFAVLGARGVTVLTGSGDGGAAGGHGAVCLTNDGTDRKVTMATFPATCPWVTAVGATTAATNPFAAAEFSGGGFSQYFPRPDWQAAEVDQYVTALDGHLDGYYNASMRAVPDLSAIGTHFLIMTAQTPSFIGGTSASCPVVASMLSLVNNERLKEGKRSLGWLNERLYSREVQAVLKDVTVGETDSCDYEGEEPGGWPSAKGWDAATGLGSVGDFKRLLNVLLKD